MTPYQRLLVQLKQQPAAKPSTRPSVNFYGATEPGRVPIVNPARPGWSNPALERSIRYGKPEPFRTRTFDNLPTANRNWSGSTRRAYGSTRGVRPVPYNLPRARLPSPPRGFSVNPRWPKWARLPPTFQRMRPTLPAVGIGVVGLFRPTLPDILFGAIPDAMEAGSISPFP
jgi:hypothetical protein